MRPLIIAAPYHVAKRIAEEMHLSPNGWMYASSLEQITGIGDSVTVYIHAASLTKIKEHDHVVAYLTSRGIEPRFI